MKQNLKNMNDAKFEKGSQDEPTSGIDSLNINNLLNFKSNSKRGGDHLELGF